MKTFVCAIVTYFPIHHNCPWGKEVDEWGSTLIQ